MNRRRQEWLHLSTQEPDLTTACVNGRQDFRVWHGEWDQAMGYLRWAQAWMEEVEKAPEKVVKWALEREPVRLN